MEKDEFGNKLPTWDDFEEHWNRANDKERLQYICEAFQCSSDNNIAVTIAKSYWEDIPEVMQEQLEGWSQLGNEVFDKLNW
jgi:hypothetical protein